ncbi:MAG: hypothetical protein AAFX87_21000 [Bacteroidota bacterium]
MKKKLEKISLGSIKDLSRKQQQKVVAGSGYGCGGPGGGPSGNPDPCAGHPCPAACNGIGWANYAWSVWGRCCTTYGCWW